MKLNQALAIEGGTKNATQNAITQAYKTIQKADLFNGRIREYQSFDELPEGVSPDDIPPNEHQIIQTTVATQIANLRQAMSDLFDITAAKVYANTGAKANVVVDNNILLENVPVEYLLFLEKQLNDIDTFIKNLPIVDASHEWTWDANQARFHSETVVTNRNKRLKKVLTLAHASEKFPAQAQVYEDDVPVGKWNTTLISAAASPSQLSSLKERVATLQVAVKLAREEANSIEVEKIEIADQVFNYIFN